MRSRNRNVLSPRLPVICVLTLAVVAAGAIQSARAQALTDVVNGLLGDQCNDLINDGNGQTRGGSDFGDGLQAICGLPQGAPSSSGGGSASVQSSTTSIQNSALKRRLERARGLASEGTRTTSLGRDRGFVVARNADRNLLADDSSDSGLRSSRFDVFVSGIFETLDRESNPFEDGYDSSIAGAAAGFDYRFTDTVVGGFVATYTSQDGDFNVGGDYEVTSIDPTFFVSVAPSPQTFFQATAGYRSQDFDVSRAVDFTVDTGGGTTSVGGVSSSSTDAGVFSLGALYGYDRSVRNYTFGPRVGVNYNRTSIDSFVETGGTGLELSVDDLTVKSLQSVVGFYGSVALSSGSGVWIPQISVEYVHEFEDERSLLSAQFAEDFRGPNARKFGYQTNEPEPDFFNVEVGVAAVLRGGIQPYLNLRVLLGNSAFDNYAGTFGVRFEL